MPWVGFHSVSNRHDTHLQKIRHPWKLIFEVNIKISSINCYMRTACSEERLKIPWNSPLPNLYKSRSASVSFIYKQEINKAFEFSEGLSNCSACRKYQIVACTQTVALQNTTVAEPMNFAPLKQNTGAERQHQSPRFQQTVLLQNVQLGISLQNIQTNALYSRLEKSWSSARINQVRHLLKS